MHLFQKTEFMNHYLIAIARSAWTVLNFDCFINEIRIKNASNSFYPAVKELTDIGDADDQPLAHTNFKNI